MPNTIELQEVLSTPSRARTRFDSSKQEDPETSKNFVPIDELRVVGGLKRQVDEDDWVI